MDSVTDVEEVLVAAGDNGRKYTEEPVRKVTLVVNHFGKRRKVVRKRASDIGGRGEEPDNR